MHRFNLLRRIPLRKCRACGRTLSRDRVAVVPSNGTTFEQICPACASWLSALADAVAEADARARLTALMQTPARVH